MVDLASIPALGTNPVPGDNPAGESLRYDPDYEAVTAELAKLGTPDASTIDWKVVVNRSADLLERTKDLVLATALANGLLMTEGMAGFAAGLDLMRGMVANFWDGLHPARSRMRARASSFEWLSERATGFFADPGNAPALTPAEVMAAAAFAEELAEFCSAERMEGEDPGLGGLLRSLREAKSQVGGDAPAGDSGAEGGGEQGADGASQGGGGMAVAMVVPKGGAALNPAGVIATRDEAFRRLAELAEFFARAEPLSPVGPLLQRATRWGRMSYKELYTELLGDSRQSLLDVLGIKPDENG